MRLYEQPCSAVTVGRRRYKLRLTYDRVLFAIDAVQDQLLTDDDRMRLMLGLLVCGRIPRSRKRQRLLLDAVMRAIDITGQASDTQPCMSLTQDAPLIHAAFRQAYGIDLQTALVPWHTFCALLSGLPEGTRFCEVVSIRTRPVPPPDKHNARYISELLSAKAAVALKVPEQQREQRYQAGLSRLADHIIAWASSGGEKHE